MTAWRAIGGTGHRPRSSRNPEGIRAQDLGWLRAKARAGLEWLAHEHGTAKVRSGLALGWDLILARAAVDVGLDLHCDIPYENQAALWSPHLRAEWAALRAAAVSETVWGENPASYRQACELLEKRNEGLLDSDAMFAAWSGRRSGGTFRCVEQAQLRGLPGVHLDPPARRVRVVAPRGWF